MKIISVNNTYNPVNCQLNSQSFKGLWGKSSRTTDYDSALGVPKVEDIYYYYPFINESEKEINNAKEGKVKAYIENNNGSDKYRIVDCRICATLPFEKKNFEDYAAVSENSALTKDIKKIHSFVENLYINHEYGNGQIPAVNDIVSKKIIDENLRKF